MSENSLAMMPWFPRDFIAATRAMRIAERCAYRELLDFQWELGVLPDDETRLARLIGFTAEEFDDAWPAIRSKFAKVEGGIANQRLEEHRKTALQKRDRQRKGADLANAKRSAKRDAEHSGDRDANRSGKHLASDTPPSPSPSPSEERVDSSARAREDSVDHAHFETFKAAYPKFSGRQNWIVAEHHYRIRLERGVTPDELQRAVERYAKYVDEGGASSTGHILRPENFLSAADEPWTQAWEPPIAKPKVAPARSPWVAPPDDEEIARVS